MKSILIIVIFGATFFIKSTDCKTSLSEKEIDDLERQFLRIEEISKCSGLNSMKKIDSFNSILLKLPKEILEEIPLDEAFENLSKENQAKARTIITNNRLKPEAKKAALRNLMRILPVDQAVDIAPIISKQSWFGGASENPLSIGNMRKFWWKKIVNWLRNGKKG